MTNQLANILKAHNLELLACLPLTPPLPALTRLENYLLPYNINKKNTALAIIGTVGDAFWPVFSKWRQHTQQHAIDNPLDNWSKHLADEIVACTQAIPLFPFDGPVYWPFIRWTLASGVFYQSPILGLIHPKWGSWISLRMALIINKQHVSFVKTSPISNTDAAPLNNISMKGSPCSTCQDKPCLSRCPVSAFKDLAFSNLGLDVKLCREYLAQDKSQQCFDHTCLARSACPIGREYRYSKKVAHFFMRAYANGLRKTNHSNNIKQA